MTMVLHPQAPRRPCAPPRAARQRGVSLVEALLALVVMAVGMLAVAGVQTTLRANGDLSRQRAEAVRIAQQSIEQRRGFLLVDDATSLPDYRSLVDGTLVPDVAVDRVNTTFSATRTVTTSPPAPGTAGPGGGEPSPPMKTVALGVQWLDRNGQAQAVNLFTVIAKATPELAASLIVPPQGGPARRPLGRHVAIPQGAVSRGDGTSSFAPPATAGLPPVAWIFDDLTGRISQVCPDPGNLSSCVANTAQFLTGYLRLALPPVVSGDPATMTADAARDPASPVSALDALLGSRTLTVTVNYRTSSSAAVARSEACYIDRGGATAADPPVYLCALPLYPSLAGEVPTWSGRLAVGPSPDPVVATAGAAAADRLRACRYFDLAGTGDHSAIATPLSQQNLVLARAGDGTNAYGCPGGAAVSVPHPPT